MLKKWPLISLLLVFGCGPSKEELQRHHNQIMVAQHRLVRAFDQLDSSLLDSAGYRLLYWEYDSVKFFIQQLNNVLDTLQAPGNDREFLKAAGQLSDASSKLHEQYYPPFLDAYRKYHSMGAREDSITMIEQWNRIVNHKKELIENFKRAQDLFVSEYNLIIYNTPMNAIKAEGVYSPQDDDQ